MKIAEKMTFEDDKLIVKKTFTATPALDLAKALRDQGKQSMGDHKVIGVIPYALWLKWANDAGVHPSDNHAMAEVMKKQMANPDNRNLRVWTGTY